MTDSSSLLGVVLNGAYKIESQLADGGMSLVFVAEQLSLGRNVVVKVLRPGFDDEDFIQLFLREARINSQINHPSVVSVFDFGQTEDGVVFIAMELLDGATLGDVLESEKVLPVSNVIWLMEQVCAGIHAAHKLDVVHRDLKPNNIMIVQVTGGDTLVKVLDFGISKPLGEEDLKHTRLGMVMGTPGYLAPEQIQGITVDLRADIYALGALLFFVLTGKRPFIGASHESIMSKQLSGRELSLAEVGIDDPMVLALQPVISRAMDVDREKRYPTVKAFWQALLDSSEHFGKVSIRGEASTSFSGFWDVVSDGGLVDGVNAKQVHKELMRVLKMTEVQSNRLVSSKKSVVIRKHLSRKDAERFKTLFFRIGLRVKIDFHKSQGLVDAKREGEVDLAAPTHVNQSLPTPGVMQPMTVAQLQRADKKVSVGASGIVSAVQPQTNRKTPFMFYGLIACVMSVILAAGCWFYLPLRYHLGDWWLEVVTNTSPPRGVNSHQITIGMSAAFQGGAKELGRSMQLGVETYFQRINDSGGIHGRRLHLAALNDGYEPALALENMKVFLDAEKGVFSLLGNVGTPTARVILPIALKNELLVVGTLSGAELLRNDPPDRYVFNYRASYAEETAAMIHYFVKVRSLRPERIGVFYQNDSYGLDGLSGVVGALQEYGVARSDVVSASYERNTVQVESAAQKFVESVDSLDAVVLVSTYSASAAFTRLMRHEGFSGEIGNVSFVGARALSELLQEMGGELGQGVLVTQVVPMYDSYASGVLQYRKDLSTYFPNEEPGFVSLEGYIVAELFGEALRRVGRNFSTGDVVKALESFSSVDLGVGHPLSFDRSDHQASHQIWGSRIVKGGQFEKVDLKKVKL